MYIAMAVGAYLLPIDLSQIFGILVTRTNLPERRGNLDAGAFCLLLYRLGAAGMDTPATP